MQKLALVNVITGALAYKSKAIMPVMKLTSLTKDNVYKAPKNLFLGASANEEVKRKETANEC